MFVHLNPHMTYQGHLVVDHQVANDNENGSSLRNRPARLRVNNGGFGLCFILNMEDILKTLG